MKRSAEHLNKIEVQTLKPNSRVMEDLPVSIFVQDLFDYDSMGDVLTFITSLTCDPDFELFIKTYERHFRSPNAYEEWLVRYDDVEFFRLFRVRKCTFHSLVSILLENDKYSLLKKKYRGGNFPVHPKKSFLMFLWYLSKPDSLSSIANRFDTAVSTVMQIVNAILYLMLQIKHKYIIWPQTKEEYEHTKRGFRNYPDAIGAIDGCHINIKVSVSQQESYINRYQQHSINLMAICNADRVFTYIYVGFPGSAHDSRVFSNSLLALNIERYGPERYFPENSHLIGDSAFPLTTWLMTPFRKSETSQMRIKRHNTKLSSD